MVALFRYHRKIQAIMSMQEEYRVIGIHNLRDVTVSNASRIQILWWEKKPNIFSKTTLHQSEMISSKCFILSEADVL